LTRHDADAAMMPRAPILVCLSRLMLLRCRYDASLFAASERHTPF